MTLISTAKPYLKGKLLKPYGHGAKILVASVKIGPVSEALHASDQNVQMRSIKAVFTLGVGTDSTIILPKVISPGSYNNYCSFTAFREGDVRTNGTVITTIRAAGSITAQMLIIGD